MFQQIEKTICINEEIPLTVRDFLSSMPKDWHARKELLENLFSDLPDFTRWCMAAASPLAENAEPYSRRVIHSGADGEVMVARWRAGAECAPHDHGDAIGIVAVLEGDFFEQSYGWNNGLVRVGPERFLTEGAAVPADPGEVHSMRALGEGYTLHFYSPAIHKMRVYDEKNGIVYTVADNCGAWIPGDQRLIVDRQAIRPDSFHHHVP